jgi:hypothetical protein
MNVFQTDYDARLRDWKDLRLTIRQIPLDEVCVKVDDWWQQAPLVNHHLHWADSETWPDPWTLLSENMYCTLTRAIGMCYTLLMSDVYDIQLVQATDLQCEEHNLVLVGKPKYVINYWPDTVLSTTLNDFTIIRTLSLEQLKQKIK